MRFAQILQARLVDALGEPKKPGPHVCWKGRDFCGNGLVQDFYSPRHTFPLSHF